MSFFKHPPAWGGSGRLGGVQCEGLSEIVDQLVELGGVAGLKSVSQAGRRAMKSVAEVAAQLAPRSAHGSHGGEPGDLANSIRLALVRPKKGSIVATIAVVVRRKTVVEEIPVPEVGMMRVKRKVDASWRWHFAEFGTSKMSPTPFIRPAWQREGSKVTEVFKREIQAAIQRALKKRARKVRSA